MGALIVGVTCVIPYIVCGFSLAIFITRAGLQVDEPGIGAHASILVPWIVLMRYFLWLHLVMCCLSSMVNVWCDVIGSTIGSIFLTVSTEIFVSIFLFFNCWHRNAASTSFSVLFERGYYILIEEDSIMAVYMVYVGKIDPGV